MYMIYDSNFNSDEYYENITPFLEDYFNSHLCIVKGTIQRWDGKKSGVSIIESYRDFLKHMEEFISLYIDDDSLVLKSIHHDGTNEFYIREMDSDFIPTFKDNEDEYCYSDVVRIFDENCTCPDLYI